MHREHIVQIFTSHVCRWHNVLTSLFVLVWAIVYLPCVINGNAMHAVRSFGCRPIFGPYFWPLLTSFWFHTGFFFSFLCIWDVAHLNCHPLLPNVNHFYPFSIPHIELSLLWGPEKAGVV